MRWALGPSLLAAALIATAAQAQGADGQFHDCISVIRQTKSIEADADGLAMRLRADSNRFYPDRAERMGKSARVSLQCRAVTERPVECVVTRETLPDFGFGPAAVRLAESGRLAAPGGIWPLEVVVAFHTTLLVHPIFVGYC